MSALRLILGGSGFLGRELRRQFNLAQTIATHHSSVQAGCAAFNALQDDLDPMLANMSPGAAVYFLFGITEIDGCLRDNTGSQTLNVDITIELMKRVSDAGMIPVYVSSDSVFDGEKGAYVEEDTANPIHRYGRQKLEVENYLETSRMPFLVVRLPKVVSAIPEPGTLFGQWVTALIHGEHVRCAHDQFFSPIVVTDVAQTLAALVEEGHTGVYHLAGPERWSRAELYDLLIAELQVSSLVDPKMTRCGIREFEDLLERRPLDCSLNCDKLRNTLSSGLRLAGMKAVCREIAGNVAAKGIFAHSK